MNIVLATRDDVGLLVRWREEASRWLAERGIDQWREPWPDHDAMVQRMLASIDAGETWMVLDNGDKVASVALDDHADPNLWTPEEQAEPARYLHRLVVTSTHRGQDLGGGILDWACDRAAGEGARWVRIDVWTDNTALQRYYLSHDFHHVRTLDPDQYPGYPSGALFQRQTMGLPR